MKKIRVSRKVVLFAFLILVLLPGANAVYQSYVCAGGDSCFDGQTPGVMCDPDGGNCPYICAAKCASLTSCSSSCMTCCDASSCSMYAAGSTRYNACMDSCQGTCDANEQFCDVINILTGIGAGVAVFMLVLNGLKWMLAEDVSGRQDAKRGMLYIFVGLLIFVVAIQLVNFLMGGNVSCEL